MRIACERQDRLRTELADLLAGQWQITLEFGCGHGHYLAAYASEHPDEYCLGLDLISQRIRKANGKAERGNINNLHFVKAEAGEFLAALPETVTVARAFMLFPDPWPKKRHHKNRMVQPLFLSGLAERCEPLAPFHFRTDHPGYFDWAMTTIAAHPDWQIEPTAQWPFEHRSYFQDLMEDWQSLIAKRVG